EDPAGLAHRAPAHAERRVAARPVDEAAQPADLLLGHLDGIEAPAADRLRSAAELAERVAHALEQIGVLVGEEARAEVAAVLLIAEDREDDVAARPDLAACRAQAGV